MGNIPTRKTNQTVLSPTPSISNELICSLTRKDISRFIRLITGHNNLNYHCYLRDNTGEHDIRCRFCEEKNETFFHLVKECPRLIGYRTEIFKDFNGPQLYNGSWEISDILRFSKEPEINDAYEFYANNVLLNDSNEPYNSDD